jgi:hypothetical protein
MLLSKQNSVFNTCLALIGITVIIGALPKPAKSAELSNGGFAVIAEVMNDGAVEFRVQDSIDDLDFYNNGYRYMLNERAEVGTESKAVSLWVRWETGLVPDLDPLADRQTRTLAYCMNSGRDLKGDIRGINLHKNLCDDKDEQAIVHQEFFDRLDRSYLKWGNPIMPEFKFEKVTTKRNLLDE